MESIRKYINIFFGKTQKNKHYTMRTDEMFEFINAITNSRDTNDRFRIICDLFNFGYVKGYRAALAEMKKGGKTA